MSSLDRYWTASLTIAQITFHMPYELIEQILGTNQVRQLHLWANAFEIVAYTEETLSPDFALPPRVSRVVASSGAEYIYRGSHGNQTRSQGAGSLEAAMRDLVEHDNTGKHVSLITKPDLLVLTSDYFSIICGDIKRRHLKSVKTGLIRMSRRTHPRTVLNLLAATRTLASPEGPGISVTAAWKGMEDEYSGDSDRDDDSGAGSDSD